MQDTRLPVVPPIPVNAITDGAQMPPLIDSIDAARLALYTNWLNRGRNTSDKRQGNQQRDAGQ